MTKFLLIGMSVAVIAVGYVFVRATISGPVAEDWLTDFEQAKKVSKDTGKPILTDFTGSDWCGWCMKLKAEVFDTTEFESWAKKNVVLLEIDLPDPEGETAKKMSAELKRQNSDLASQYHIEGFPTILFMDADGHVLAQNGYLPGGPQKWIEASEKMLASKR